MKISAVRSLADICFLHVLFGILIVLFNWVFWLRKRRWLRLYISSCQLVVLPSGLLTPHATPLFFYFYAVDFIFMLFCVPPFFSVEILVIWARLAQNPRSFISALLLSLSLLIFQFRLTLVLWFLCHVVFCLIWQRHFGQCFDFLFYPLLPDLASSFWPYVLWTILFLRRFCYFIVFCLIWQYILNRGSDFVLSFLLWHRIFCLYCVSPFLSYFTFCLLLLYFISCRRSTIGDLAWSKLFGRSIFA